MEKYVVKKAFIDGKDEHKKLCHYKKGEVYKGKRAEEFLAKGNIVKQSALDLEDHAAVEKKIEAAKAELAALEAKLKMHPGKSAASAPSASGKPSTGK